MRKDGELWNFIHERLSRGEDVMFLVVAESTGSSPGRAGYKMAIGTDGALIGSVGGGVMEVDLVERSKAALACPSTESVSGLSQQTHRRNAEHPSGMICSGEQTVILQRLGPRLIDDVARALQADTLLAITEDRFSIEPHVQQGDKITFTSSSNGEFCYKEHLTVANDLYIIGGGHCSLALSEVMSRMEFRIHIFDDRPELNTIQKNEFADEIRIVEGYENLGDTIAGGPNSYVVVMTLGYNSDALVIQQLVDSEFKYFGVLGSKAKMATLLKDLRSEGISADRLDRIRTPIGLPIRSRTPEEIAISIAAEIILIKNS